MPPLPSFIQDSPLLPYFYNIFVLSVSLMFLQNFLLSTYHNLPSPHGTVSSDPFSDSSSSTSSSDKPQLIKFFFHAHGWLAKDQCGEHLRQSLVNHGAINAKSKSSTVTIVHSAKCNHGRTNDGVVNGGTRLASEIKSVITHELNERNITSESKVDITVTLIGNSLGGLYMRYAISLLLPLGATQIILPNLPPITPDHFATTVSPYLGTIPDLGYISYLLPDFFIRFVGGLVMGTSVRDMLRVTEIVGSMGWRKEFLEPLACFKKRTAFSNAYSTDTLVSHTTALFLNDDSSLFQAFVEPQNKEEKEAWEKALVTAVFETDKTYTGGEGVMEGEMELDEFCSRSLDSLGWMKYIIDVRSLVVPPSHLPALKSLQQSQKNILENDLKSCQLNNFLGLSTPAEMKMKKEGHKTMVANMKTAESTEEHKGGRVFIDFLAVYLSY